MKIALIGNPNCGKTTLFNRITGSRLPVGNRAGVTVETARGQFGKDEIFDLPGIYSLACSKNEEKEAASFLKEADYVLNVVDAEFLSRSLLLTSQLLSEKIPMTVILNMTDKRRNKDLSFDGEYLSKALGCPVVILKKNEKDFSVLIQKTNPKNYRIFSGDITEKYEKFDKIAKNTVNGKRRKTAEKLDKILLNKYLAFPIFLIIMSAVLMISTGFFGTFLGGYISRGIELLAELIKKKFTSLPPFIVSLIADGILTGVGSVVGFLPLVVGMFFMLAALEDCGYLARAAVILDRIFSYVGVSGKTAISLILGCGCTVPAVMSARTLDEGERISCLKCVHFVPCGGKLPVLSALAACCFDKGFLFVPLFYFLGIVAVLLSLLLSKNEENPPFVLELPPLQLAYMPSVVSATREKLNAFLLKTVSVVFWSSIAVWFLTNFDFSFRSCAPENSLLATVCGFLECLFLPIGLADWRIVASFVAGFAGKETILGVLSVMSGGNISSVFDGFSAMQYALFLLLSPPCAASLSALKNELGKKFLPVLLRQFAIAYAVCALIYVGKLLATAIV